jgi:hypothetical protein
LQLKKRKVPSVGENVQKLGPFYIVGGIQNGAVTVGNTLVFPQTENDHMVQEFHSQVDAKKMKTYV